jgi:hypothetical protein
MICDGPSGNFLEVTPEKNIIWQYTNPYPSYGLNDVFKVIYYPPEDHIPEEPDLDCEGNIRWINVEPGETVYSSFKVSNVGGINSKLNWEIVTFPDWGTWTFNPISGENQTPNDGQINVLVSVIAPDEEKNKVEGYIRVENSENLEDYNEIPVYLETPRKRSISSSFIVILINHPNLYQIYQYFLYRLSEYS